MWYDYYPFIPRIPNDNELPPTIFYILDSYCNGDKTDILNDEYIKPTDLARRGRGAIFDFTYPLSTNVSREQFEVNILNKFIERRIGRETLTAFKIALEVKLNEIMPKYNKLFDATIDWNLFNDGEKYVRTYNETRNDTGSSSSVSNNESDRRYSNEPQNEIQDIKDGTYMTEYNLDTDKLNSSNNSSTNGSTGITETINRSPADKFKLYKDMLELQDNIYSMIYKDLSVLFYALI